MDVYIEKPENITNRIEDELSDVEGKLIYSLAKNVPEDQVIVAIGKGNEESTVWLAKGSTAGNMNRVYSIRSRSVVPDAIEANDGNTNVEFIDKLESAGVDTFVITSYSDSEDTSRKWKDKVGLLLISTLFEYEDIKHVFINWERHLSPNARVVVCGFNQLGPARLIKEYLGNLGDFTFEKRVGTLKVIRIDKCIHHWIIDANEIGICRHCGRKRNFKRIMREADAAGARKRQAAKSLNTESQTKRKK
jgi:hypothetical protein